MCNFNCFLSRRKDNISTGHQDAWGSYGKAKLWDIESQKVVRVFEGHKSWVLSVSFSPDGKEILTGSADKTARIWLIDTGAEIATFVGIMIILIRLHFRQMEQK